MIVCRCSMHPETYEAMETYFTKCQTDGMTNMQVFHNNKTLEQFRALAMRNRRRICHEFADAIGARVRFRTYSKSPTPCKIANLVCETEASCAPRARAPPRPRPRAPAARQSNFVRFSGDTMLFYAGCTDTAEVTDGLVFNRAPLLGPLVYIGPSNNRTRTADSGMFGGNKWYNKLHNAFPTGERPHTECASWAAFTKLGFSITGLANKLLCDGDLETNDLLLRTFPYRQSTDRGLEIEKLLGYDFKGAAQSIVVCRPVVVKASEPPTLCRFGANVVVARADVHVATSAPGR